MASEALQLKKPVLRWPKTSKYWQIVKINYLNQSAYLSNLFSRGLTILLRIWIFTQIYRATFALAGIPQIGGLTLAMTIWSLMLTQSIQNASRPSLIRVMDDEVKTGTLAYSIGRPYSYQLFQFFGYMGRLLPNLAANILIGSAAAIILVGPIYSSFTGLLLGLILILFAYILDFLMSFIIGLSALWVEDTNAFVWIYQKGVMVFGGAILPLTLFPDYLRRISEFLPFSQLGYSAARIIVSPDLALFIKYVSVQLGWILVFSLISYWAFNKGIKYVAINGG